MERARATWTDERLDDLSTSVGRVDEDVRHLRGEMHTRFDALEGRLGNRIDAVDTRLGGRIDIGDAQLGNRIDALDARLGAKFDALNRTLIQVGGGTIVTVLATLVAVLATRA